MSAGLIFGNMLSGLGQGVAQAAGLSWKEDEREEERRLRQKLLDERLEVMRDRAALAAEAKGGRGGDAPIGNIEPGSLAEKHAASGMGKDAPGFRKFDQAMSTGDWSGYGTKIDDYQRKGADENQDVSGEMSDAVSRKTATLEKVGSHIEMPLMWEKEKAEMMEKYHRESGGILYGKNWEHVAKGNEQDWKTKQEQGIVAGADPKPFARSQAAEKGKLRDNLGEAGTYDVVDGDQKLNPLGKAKADDEKSSAANRGKEVKNKSFEALQQERIAIDADLKLIGNSIDKERAGMRDLGSAGKKEAEKRIAKLEAERDEARAYKTRVMERLSGISAPAKDGASKGDKPAAAKAEDDTPPASALKEGVRTTFRNGQSWTLKNGKPTRL